MDTTTTHKSLRDEIEAKPAGHPSVFSVAKDNKLALRLKDLAETFIGYSPKQICKKDFLFAYFNVINHLWDKDKMCAGKGRFLSFMK